MTPLQRAALYRTPLTEAEVEALYCQFHGITEFVLERNALCESHERLRVELDGVEALLASARFRARGRRRSTEIVVVEAGIDPSHQVDHCDHCEIKSETGIEMIETCNVFGPVTLCRSCYNKAGNSVR